MHYDLIEGQHLEDYGPVVELGAHAVMAQRRGPTADGIDVYHTYILPVGGDRNRAYYLTATYSAKAGRAAARRWWMAVGEGRVALRQAVTSERGCQP